MEISGFDKIVNFIFEVGTANNILRSHHQVLKNSNDTVASHSFRTAVVGLLLADLEKVDKDKVVKMCLFHDLAEMRTGDANFINKFYRREDEEKAIQDQWQGLSLGSEIIKLLDEYNKRESKEAIVAKDADRLEQIFLQKEYINQDKYSAERWHNHILKDMKTESARKIAQLALNTNPLKWLYDFSDNNKKSN